MSKIQRLGILIFLIGIFIPLATFPLTAMNKSEMILWEGITVQVFLEGKTFIVN